MTTRSLTRAAPAPRLLFLAALISSAGCGAAPAPAASGEALPPSPPPPPEPPSAPPERGPAQIAVGPIEAGPSGPYRCEGQAITAGGRSYCAYLEGATFEDAERGCLARGGHLAAIGSAQENADLRGAVGSPIGAGTSLWIGLTEPAEGRWVWSDGSIPKSGRWATGEPNNAGGNENCVEWYVSSGAWNDADCATPRGFVCEARTRGKASKFGCTGRLLTLAGVEYCVYPDSARDWGAIANIVFRLVGAHGLDEYLRRLVFVRGRLPRELPAARAEDRRRRGRGHRAGALDRGGDARGVARAARSPLRAHGLLEASGGTPRHGSTGTRGLSGTAAPDPERGATGGRGGASERPCQARGWRSSAAGRWAGSTRAPRARWAPR
ncbi:MAG: C-type lectin domain-containing protein [Polyangiaceae bacterium]|nr:C-type lectin domain-containing protein [Polyangiaceae bacterium]